MEKMATQLDIAYNLIAECQQKPKMSAEKREAFYKMLDYMIFDSDIGSNLKMASMIRGKLDIALFKGFISDEKYDYYSGQLLAKNVVAHLGNTQIVIAHLA